MRIHNPGKKTAGWRGGGWPDVVCMTPEDGLAALAAVQIPYLEQTVRSARQIHRGKPGVPAHCPVYTASTIWKYFVGFRFWLWKIYGPGSDLWPVPVRVSVPPPYVSRQKKSKFWEKFCGKKSCLFYIVSFFTRKKCISFIILLNVNEKNVKWRKSNT